MGRTAVGKNLRDVDAGAVRREWCQAYGWKVELLCMSGPRSESGRKVRPTEYDFTCISLA